MKHVVSIWSADYPASKYYAVCECCELFPADTREDARAYGYMHLEAAHV